MRSHQPRVYDNRCAVCEADLSRPGSAYDTCPWPAKQPQVSGRGHIYGGQRIETVLMPDTTMIGKLCLTCSCIVVGDLNVLNCPGARLAGTKIEPPTATEIQYGNPVLIRVDGLEYRIKLLEDSLHGDTNDEELSPIEAVRAEAENAHSRISTLRDLVKKLDKRTEKLEADVKSTTSTLDRVTRWIFHRF